MILSEAQRNRITAVVNVFETGSPQGDYGTVVVYKDGPGRIPQITYGRSQTTEYGSLPELLQAYVESGGQYAADMAPYLPALGSGQLHADAAFKALLRKAGADPIMRRTQDSFFDEKYFNPARAWAEAGGFSLALSMLVVYDSFIHSGRVPDYLRKRFPEVPPAKGGVEQAWVRAYVDVRQAWLANHSNEILHKTVYRTECFRTLMAQDNWDLEKTPIMANGVAVG